MRELSSLTSIEVTTHVAISIARIILYVQEIPKVARFYERYFGMKPLPSDNKAWLELASEGGGCVIALHQASRAQKSGAADEDRLRRSRCTSVR